jgi:hypothetical protein
VEPEVGSDLDAAVAEGVMRWRHRAVPPGTVAELRWLDPSGGVRFRAPPYSTEIGAAWEVVERLLRRHPGFELTYWDDSPRPWAAAFGARNYPDDAWGDGRGRTAAEAICRAALAACGATGRPEG